MQGPWVVSLFFICVAASPRISHALNGWGYFFSPPDRPGVEWGYHGARGPEHWGKLSADFQTCSSGKAQSPVDVSAPRAVRMPPLSFHYRANQVSMVNNGHTVKVEY